jgi:hypothetical protein
LLLPEALLVLGLVLLPDLPELPELVRRRHIDTPRLLRGRRTKPRYHQSSVRSTQGAEHAVGAWHRPAQEGLATRGLSSMRIMHGRAAMA